jgi:hypothetical protein
MTLTEKQGVTLLLTVEEYEERERQAVTELPNRVVEMVQPVVFSTLGYPTRVSSDSELWKYVDVMHETRFDRDIVSLFDRGLTDGEFDALKQVAKLVTNFSREKFSKNLTTRGSLLRALHVYRHIKYIFGTVPGRIFEIGPGCGYLGCLLLLDGWGYIATDIAQAFYLFQNHLWNYFTGGQVRELAHDKAWDGSIASGRAVHIPWWQFYEFLSRDVPQVDIVTCNHALAEMHPNSLAFTLRVARKMLDGPGLKAFVFDGWGYELLVHRSEITEQFYRCGFRLVHNDDKITVFAPEGGDCAVPSAHLPVLRSRLIKRIVATAKIMLGRRVGSISFNPPHFISTQNIVSRLILEGRVQRLRDGLVGLEEIDRFFRDLLGSDDIRSPDEQFVALIGKEY